MLKQMVCLVFLFASSALHAQVNDAALVDKVLNQLDITPEQCECSLLAELQLSNNETLLVIPEIALQEESNSQYHGHIVIVNADSGVIKARLPDYLVWESDGLYLDSIDLQIPPYTIAKNTITYGLLVKHKGSSSVNPFGITALTLFVRQQEQLRAVLSDYPLVTFRGENNGYDRGEIEEDYAVIMPKPDQNKGFYDLAVNHTITKTTMLPDSEKTAVIDRSTKTLVYQNDHYVSIENKQ